MTGVITSLPPLVEQPPGSNASNPAGLAGVTYTAAIPTLAQTWTGIQSFSFGTVLYLGQTSGNTILNASPVASGVLTLPAATDTLVARNTTDTLTNKTLTAPTINGATISGTFSGGTYSGVTITGASTYNGNTWTTGTGTLALGAGKTATISNTLTFAGTDGTTQTFPATSGAVLTSVTAAGGGLTGTYPNPTVATVPASALPNPSASTLGGIQSLAAVGSRWINTISTSGVPSATQPAFTDISGSVGATQMPAHTGDVTTPAGSVVTTITANAVTNAKMATMAAVTLKGNPTNATANAADFTIQGLTSLASPSATLDFIPIYDHISGTIKNATPGAIAASSVAGVSSLNSATGAISLSVVKQIFTVSGTYTPTAGMKYCIVEAVGGGGGGGATTGSASPNQFGGGGGQSGSYARSWIAAATIGASKAVTVGAHGAGGVAGNNAGGNGGDTSLGTLVIAKGGAGGGFGNNVTVGRGGWSTTASTGDFVEVGAPGTAGLYATVNTVTVEMGQGASSAFGGGGGAASHLTSNIGNNAAGFGGGGSGGISVAAINKAGGDGFDGVLIVTEFVIA